jgi:hypothetical protein
MKEHYNLLHHALGIKDPDQVHSFRNYFAASNRHHDLQGLLELCGEGLMVEGNTPSFCHDEQRTFYVTENGRLLAFNTRPKPPKLTKGQKRYKLFLSMDSEYTFGDWLKDPFFNEQRRREGCK